MRHLKHILSVIICIAYSGIVAAQNDAQMSKAVDLFNRKMYQNSMSEFNKYIRQNGTNETAEGYRVLCAIYLGQSNVEGQAKSFSDSYPSSAMLPEIKFRLAVLYYEKEEFRKASKMFNEISPNTLHKRDRDEYFFRKGFCEFKEAQYKAATRSFTEAITQAENFSSDRKGLYIIPAKYYLGYIKYINKDFRGAIDLFTQSAADIRFRELSKFYNLDCYFMLKEYDYVVNNGPELYEKLKDDNKSRTARMIAESYYAKGDAKSAMKYFKEYSSASDILSQNDIFFGGIVAYTLKEYKEAADYFIRISDSGDSLSQSANYHLGECDIRLGDKQGAKEAFFRASQSSFDGSIKEDAAFNHAKLQFELTGDTRAITQYLEKYNINKQKSDILYSYLATDAIKKRAYDKAVAAIGKISSPTKEDMVNYKKANLFRGMELLDMNSEKNALRYLQNAADNESYNIPLSNLAKFWIAECHYRNGKYSESQKILCALQKNKEFRSSDEYADSYFNNGYNYFKLKDLQKAERAFKTYISLPGADKSLIEEAKMRIADCRFMSRNFEGAIEMYESAANDGSIYPLLQSAIAQGLMSNYKEKAAILKRAAAPENKNKEHYTEALFELGRTQTISSDTKGAEESFKRLIENPVDSLYYCQSLLELGMISSNRGDYSAAETYYKKIILARPNSPEAQAALNALENLSQIMDKPEEFLSYVKQSNATLGKTSEEREEIIFNSAEQVYLAEKWSAAAKALEEFIEEYPASGKLAKATYYLADSYKNLKKSDKAASYYKDLIGLDDTPYLESALVNYAEIMFGKKEYEEAAEAYRQLGDITEVLDYKIPSYVGYLRCKYLLDEFDKAIESADIALSLDSLADNTRSQILYMKAKSLLSTGNKTEALKVLRETAENASSEEGSEASYLIVKQSFDDGDMDSVEQQVFTLSEKKRIRSYWLAKSFILLGDSYIERGDKEKALATYKSIRDNYRPADGNDDIKGIVVEKIRQAEGKR